MGVTGKLNESIHLSNVVNVDNIYFLSIIKKYNVKDTFQGIGRNKIHMLFFFNFLYFSDSISLDI